MGEIGKEKAFYLMTASCFFAAAASVPFSKMEFPLAAGSFLQYVKSAFSSQGMLFLIPIVSVLTAGASYVRESSGGFLKLDQPCGVYQTKDDAGLCGRISPVFFRGTFVSYNGIFIFISAGIQRNDRNEDGVGRRASAVAHLPDGRNYGRGIRDFCRGFLQLLYGVRPAVCLFLSADYFKRQISAGFVCDRSEGVDTDRELLGSGRKRNMGIFSRKLCVLLSAARIAVRVSPAGDLKAERTRFRCVRFGNAFI